MASNYRLTYQYQGLQRTNTFRRSDRPIWHRTHTDAWTAGFVQLT